MIIQTKTEPAEVKEQIQRTNIFKGEFSPSGIESARCFRRIYLHKILGYNPIGRSAPLTYGTAIHAGVEAFYSLHGKGATLPEIQQAAVTAFINSIDETGHIGDSKRTIEGGIVTMNAYCSHYFHDDAHYELEDIESDQWLPMPNGTNLLVKIDRVLNSHGQIIVADTKTTSGYITDWFFSSFENHLPTTLYSYVIGSLLGQCDSVQIDAIKVPHPSARSKAEAFGRASFIRTEEQMKNAIDSYCRITDYVMETLARPEGEQMARMYCNHGECNKFGPCQWLPICRYGLGYPNIENEFEKKEVVR